ncbi:MAG: LysR substrate-binding domain-containing protein [Sneathiellales bacterium]|nr:LysR substrate-binding domain-containing protein [Sneathiellales bacterium]
MKTLPLNALRAFAQIYKDGGIRSAARALDVSHSAVSRHLRELEAWIGTDLIDRSREGRTLSFTSQGRRLGETALNSFSELQQVTESLREKRSVNSVLVETTPSFASRWLLPKLPEFEAAFPRIKVSILVEQRQRNPTSIGCDLSIRMGGGPWEERMAKPFMSDDLIPVASPGYLKAKGEPQQGDDLCRHNLLHDRDPNTSWQHWAKVQNLGQLDTRTGQRFNSSDLVIRAAEQGLGIALAPFQLAEDSLKSGLLLPVLEHTKLRLENAYWIIPAERQHSNAMTIFISWLEEKAGASLM